MSPIQQMLLGVGAVATKTYVDDVFSTSLYSGTGSARTINNGIDLSGEGGLVWAKSRNESWTHMLIDTVRGGGKVLFSQLDFAEVTRTDLITAFNSNGYTAGEDNSYGSLNHSGTISSSWTFRKAPGFFDCITHDFPSPEASSVTLNHSLGCLPGMVIVKSLESNYNWWVFHKSLTSGNYRLLLNEMNAQGSFGGTGYSATSTTVTIPGTATEAGEKAVIYLFADGDDSAAQIFGESGNKSVIKCGSYTGSGSAGLEVNVGFEPQWVLLKRSSGGNDAQWELIDSMRGIVSGGNEAILSPNSDDDEYSGQRISVSATGFQLETTAHAVNQSGETFVYCAIRRPDGYVGKQYGAGEGTSVFNMATGNSSSTAAFTSGFPIDFALYRQPATSQDMFVTARLMQGDELDASTNVAEAAWTGAVFDSNTTWGAGTFADSDYQSWMWKRHTGFTVCAYKGDGVAGHQITHDMNAVPQMMWIKNRGETANWIVYHKDLNGGTNPEKYYLRLNSNDAEIDLTDLGLSTTLLFNDTAPTSTVVTLGNSGNVNKNDYNHIMMLFASVDGISKVGSYTGTGASSSPFGPSISLDFQPRFIMIKNASSTGNWGVWDSVRGLGNETANKLMLNSDNAQSGLTWIRDVNSSGFKLYNSDADINTSGDTYIYYCHA